MVREVVHDVLFLGQKSEPATQADKQVAIDLLDTLKAHEEGCVGMAANMIGVRKRIIAVNMGFMNVAMFNPRIVKKSGSYQTEGNIFKLDKITYKSIKKIPEVNAYIEQGNRVLGILGYTEHSRGHAVKVAETAGDILEKLGYNEHTVELAQIAGYMHDMGNCVNRVDHAHSSALMAFQLLREWKVPDEDIAAIVSAIGQHDEKTGTAVDAVSAALILADKTDVRRNRVRNPIKETFDIHDRVNYAAVASSLQVNVEKKVILLEIELDEEICSILDYFEIFLQRMLMCKRAAEILGLKFKMKANGNKIC